MKTGKFFFAAFGMIAAFHFSSHMYAQNVGINPNGIAPNASAGLDVDFTNKGILIPRVSLSSTTDVTTIASPANSLLVYNTNSAMTGGTVGYWYYDTGIPAWVQLLNGGSPGTAWLTLGNTGTTAGTNFIGTTDAKDLVFKTSGTEWMRILSGGNVGIGATAPVTAEGAKLFVDNGNIAFEGAAPDLIFYETDQPADNKEWHLIANGAELYLQASQDAIGNGGGNLFKFTRSLQQVQTFQGDNSGIPWFSIDNNVQRVGIGTINPQAGLQITSSSYMQEGAATNTAGIGMGVQNNGGLGLSPRISLDDGLGNANVYGNQWNIDNFDGAFRIFSATTGAFFIGSNGNIGIGNIGGFPPSVAHLLQLSTDDAAKPGTNTWTIASDARLKKDIAPFTDGLEVLLKINPVRYRYNGLANMPTDKENIGIIAQEIQKVAPYTVGTFKTRLHKDDTEETELLDFNSHALTFVTINAVKELNRQNQELKKKVDSQQAEIAAIKSEYESRLKALEEILEVKVQK